MKIAFGSDLKNATTDKIQAYLAAKGHEVMLFGAVKDGNKHWSAIGESIGKAVANKTCDEGIVCCWTGTGVSIAANKVNGIRAALCNDAGTARGARLWNDANVLAMSLRLVTEALAEEVLDAWFAHSVSTENEDLEYIDYLKKIDKN